MREGIVRERAHETDIRVDDDDDVVLHAQENNAGARYTT